MAELNNFSRFGNTFQTKLIYCLLHDVKFTEQIVEYLDTKYFENESFAWSVDMIKTHFVKYNNPPTLEAVAVYVKEIPNDMLKVTVKDALRDIFKDTTDLDFVKDRTIEFCQVQALKSAVMDSVNILQSTEVNKIVPKIKRTMDLAFTVGLDSDVGHIYTEMFEQRISESSRKTVKTGWSVIDNLMAGGLGPGELGVIVAPAGIGKSWALVSMAATALKNGLNVIYYTMELSDTYVGLRFDSHLTSIPSQNLKFHKEEVEERLSEITGNLIIKYYPTKTATLQTIKNHIEKSMKIKQFKPDLVCVDYADLLAYGGISKNMEERFVLKGIYDELRGLAGELQIPIWTASQANRSAVETDVIAADKVSEAYFKVMIADCVISLSRKITDKVSGTARFHVMKNRFGRDGVTFPSKFNASNGQIEIFEEKSFSGKEVSHKMENGNDVIRDLLNKKHQELYPEDDKDKSGFE